VALAFHPASLYAAHCLPTPPQCPTQAPTHAHPPTHPYTPFAINNCLQWCWPFNQPVDTVVYKDYLLAVKQPMDFSTVKKKIEQGEGQKI
jgi:hypothetical protein